MRIKLIFSCLLLISYFNSLQAKQLPLQHGVNITDKFNIADYWVSEKLDGVRGFWNGKTLYTRQGNKIQTPSWFVHQWPNIQFDGELWSERNDFQGIVSCVKNQSDNDECWKGLKLMVFDLPANKSTFSQRVLAIRSLNLSSKYSYLSHVKQRRLTSRTALYQMLDSIVDAGGEGLMLHHQNAKYMEGRNSGLMKLKKYQDDEAIVIKHFQGKGKFSTVMGALLVETKQGVQFKIGTGFTLHQRKHPPLIGSSITFKYVGKTKRGVPRFASFLRVRN